MSSPTLNAAVDPGPSAVRRAAAAVFARQNLPLLATVVVCAAMYGYAAVSYESFADAGTFLSLFGRSAAFWGVTAVGMTFVILAGGIDLSVGSVIACSTVVVALLVEHRGWSPWAAIPAVLALGAAFGAGQGALVQAFAIPPFLITLGGLFLVRGLALVLSPAPVLIDHPVYANLLTTVAVPLGHDTVGRQLKLPLQAVLFGLVLAAGFVVARFTRFGRAVYAVGGNEQSAVLLGLPVARVKVGAYAISGFCAALGGVIFTIDSPTGSAITAPGIELTVIAAVVVGGTLLSGGQGSVVGTLFGFLTFSILQLAIVFRGSGDASDGQIITGVLLLGFVLLQKGVARRRR